MSRAVPMIEARRGQFIETIHRGHAVICGPDGSVHQAWGDPDALILPRSAVKMIQALPMVESGAAEAVGLDDARLALACASHIASPVHTRSVTAWLDQLGLEDADLACGPQAPRDRAEKLAMIREGREACRVHNNCSGKHAGMLTLAKHLGAPTESYVDIDSPVQGAILDVFGELTRFDSPGFGIDGCSAPNHAVSLHGLARAMAFFATARDDGTARQRSAHRLVAAMIAHPHMVNGENRPCTELMRATQGRAALKTGAEGCYVAILPEAGLGVAVKIEDGAERAQQAAITALLVHLGVLDAGHPAALRWGSPSTFNFAGQEVGSVGPAPGFPT